MKNKCIVTFMVITTCLFGSPVFAEDAAKSNELIANDIFVFNKQKLIRAMQDYEASIDNAMMDKDLIKITSDISSLKLISDEAELKEACASTEVLNDIQSSICQNINKQKESETGFEDQHIDAVENITPTQESLYSQKTRNEQLETPANTAHTSNNKLTDNYFLYALPVFAILIFLIVGLGVYRNSTTKGRGMNNDVKKDVSDEDIVNDSQVIRNQSPLTKKTDNNVTGTHTEIKGKNSNNKINVNKKLPTYTETKSWRIFSHSIQGKDHLEKTPPIPCQDNHSVKSINDDWGVAVVCDGAGSHKYSHFGSEFVAETLSDEIVKYFPDSEIMKTNTLPSADLWRKWCKALFLKLRQEHIPNWLTKQVNLHPEENMSIHNIGCTVILVVYSPIGLLVARIGDGRAGYKDKSGWKSMMTPFKGEYANNTVFINTDHIYTHQLENVKEPGNPYLETRIIPGSIEAFVLMSDGCEKGMYNIDKYDVVSKKNIPVNKPIDGFSKIIDLLQEKLSTKKNTAALELYDEIVREGNEPLKIEGDDKTLILGFGNKNTWKGV